MVPSPPPQPRSAAQPLAPEDRARFLQDVAAELEKLRSDLGPGLIARVTRDAQKRHFDPPSFTGGSFAKHGR